MKTLIALAIAALLAFPVMLPAEQQIRDGSGNLIGTRTRVGDRYEIRDGSRNLIGQENREGQRTIFRDGSGNKIGEIDRGSDHQDD